MAEPKSIKRRIKIVASGEKPSFSKPRVIICKKTNKNRTGKNKIKSKKIKHPMGKKNIL